MGGRSVDALGKQMRKLGKGNLDPVADVGFEKGLVWLVFTFGVGFADGFETDLVTFSQQIFLPIVIISLVAVEFTACWQTDLARLEGGNITRLSAENVKLDRCTLGGGDDLHFEAVIEFTFAFAITPIRLALEQARFASPDIMTDRDGKGINKVLTRKVKGFYGIG